MTKPLDVVLRAVELDRKGQNHSQIARTLGVSRAAVREWLSNPQRRIQALSEMATHSAEGCSLIGSVPHSEYAYLLGQYLGDGCISAIGPRGVFKLRIATCDDYPRTRQQCAEAIAAVMPNNTVGFQPCEGCTEVWSHSKHWPCLFPQHGPGRKHERSIVLAPWQEQIVSTQPELFVAGLIHSDGSRCTNNVNPRGKPYSYPRYFFTNSSYDILMLCGWAFDLLGVDWRQNRWNSLSVAKRDSVALLDTFIGPKT
jgi:hypothetical protein